jgi:hypothetical protein
MTHKPEPMTDEAILKIDDDLLDSDDPCDTIALCRAIEAACDARWEEATKQLREDAELLEWLQKHLFVSKWNGVVGQGCKTQWMIDGGHRHTTKHMENDDITKDFRAAIRAAMKGTT